ncbi:hypothetical protein Mal64_09840 [Pseudobythopirellula maris]|uniref:Uncharacterized protein n=1 Tax=Pseudobythopirellula maris TaxID=2527991 RepID=A0A5C5ZTM1_9BACT|nr:hypothetical protein [Pseudobythopirellula maris]TWT90590.1 hypothetical protein Mal64_09840 [Pseudobythopirellula maris]
MLSHFGLTVSRLGAKFRWLAGSAAILVAAPTFAATTTDWEQSSPYYEDDAWYDVTEMFDGNDYNPTDERWGVWDDEIYGNNDRTSLEYDTDNDTYYGYDSTASDDSWFYDSYDPGYTYYDGWDAYDDTIETYEYSHNYHDYDNDGFFDAYTSYYDWDNDGFYEDIEYYSFNNEWVDDEAGSLASQRDPSQQNSGQQASNQQSQRSSKAFRVSGSIDKQKTVKVRGTEHTVVMVRGMQNQDQTAVVDLGPKSDLPDFNLKKGSLLTATGPVTKVKDKRVILAQQAKQGDIKHQVDRQPKPIEGAVTDTRDVQVRGEKHRLLVMTSSDDKKILVDAGQASRLAELDLSEDAKLTVRGVPVKANDRMLVMAESLTQDGKQVSVKRQARKSGDSKPQGGGTEQSGNQGQNS